MSVWPVAIQIRTPVGIGIIGGTRSADLEEAANGQRHSMGSAPWRDMPERYGNWNSVFVRFSRWSKLGVWDAAFETLTSLGPPADEESLLLTTVGSTHYFEYSML